MLSCHAAPSALVVARLCAAGRKQGRELLRLVRAARLAFHSGTLPASFTVETAGAGRAMQLLLSHLQAMQAAVASHSDVEGAALHRRMNQGLQGLFPYNRGWCSSRDEGSWESAATSDCGLI